MNEIRHDALSDVLLSMQSDTWRQTPIPQLVGGYLQAAYNTDGIAQTIVDRPAEDALAQGFVVEGDEGEDVLNELDRFGAIPVIINAVQWARLDGASAILVRVRDGLSMLEPLDLGRIEAVLGVMDFPATSISPGTRRYSDPTQMNFGQPSTYYLRGKEGQEFEVHETRLIKVSGDTAAWSGTMANQIPWMGRSALASCYQDLTDYRDAMSLVPLIMEMKQQPISKMKGLNELLSKKLDEVVKTRLRLVDRSRSMLKTVAVDGDDSFEISDSALAGIGETVRTVEKKLIASSKIHGAVLFGDEAKGIGDAGHSNQGIYHGLLARTQNRQVKPALEALLVITWAQSAYRARQPEKWRIKFNALYSPTAKEVAEARKINAEARKVEFEAIQVAISENAMSGDEMRVYIAKDCPEYEIDAAPLPKLDPGDDPANDPKTTPPAGGGAE